MSNPMIDTRGIIIYTTHTFSLDFWNRNRYRFQSVGFWLVIHIDSQKSEELVKFSFGKWFCEMISNVPDAWDVIHNELLLFHPINQPEETHIH